MLRKICAYYRILTGKSLYYKLDYFIRVYICTYKIKLILNIVTVLLEYIDLLYNNIIIYNII